MENVRKIGKKGKIGEIYLVCVHQQNIYIEIVDKSMITCEFNELSKKSPIRPGDQVVTWCDGEVIRSYIVDFKQRNYLPRFKLKSGRWVGKTRIIGKVING